MTTDNPQNPLESSSEAQSATEKPVEAANNTTETPELQAQPKVEQPQTSSAAPPPPPVDPVQAERQVIVRNLTLLLRIIQRNLACQESLKIQTLDMKKAVSFGRQWGSEANSNFVLAVKVKRRLAKAKALLAS